MRFTIRGKRGIQVLALCAVLGSASFLFHSWPRRAGTPVAGKPSAQTGRVVKVAEGMLRRLATSAPMPAYPAELLTRRVEGPVVAAILTTPEGSTQQVTILQAPDVAMDRAVRNALRGWRFEPVKVRDSQDQWHIKGTLTFYFRVTNGQGVVASPDELSDAATRTTAASSTPARIPGAR